MITIRNNFADLPPMVREQISWYVFFFSFSSLRMHINKSQERRPSSMYGAHETHIPFCPACTPSVCQRGDTTYQRAFDPRDALNIAHGDTGLLQRTANADDPRPRRTRLLRRIRP